MIDFEKLNAKKEELQKNVKVSSNIADAFPYTCSCCTMICK